MATDSIGNGNNGILATFNTAPRAAEATPQEIWKFGVSYLKGLDVKSPAVLAICIAEKSVVRNGILCDNARQPDR